jgi:hypothetical protein
MPRLADNEMDTHQIGAGRFAFTGARIANLGATEYTLATIAIDVTGSLQGQEKAIHDMLVAAARACQKSPRSDNLLLRVVEFNSSIGVREVHGFKPLAEIDIAAYQEPRCLGGTPLYDAGYSAVGATNVYGAALNDQDFLANAISFIITDGEDTCSVATPAMIAEEIKKSIAGEDLESHVTILIGMISTNTSKSRQSQLRTLLEHFKNEAGLTQFIDAGDATPGKLAKLGEFVSRSVSSTSQALGTGGASQQIAATI